MKRIVTMQDISCIGKCSLTVALPIISAMGIETAILPTAVLSTHTAFENCTIRDLTGDLDGILNHWISQGFEMDGVYTGYLGSIRQVEFVRKLIKTYPSGIHLVDPAMADNGKLYAGFTDEFVSAMTRLCGEADYIVPNLTEACLMTGTEYRPDPDTTFIKDLLKKLASCGAKNILMTGYSSSENTLGAICYCTDRDEFITYENEKAKEFFHGTGDIFASTLFGALTLGYSTEEAMQITVDFVLESLRQTLKEEPHNTYGVNFEWALGSLIERLKCKP